MDQFECLIRIISIEKKVKVKVVVLSSDSMTAHVQQTLPFPWQGGCQCSLQLLMQACSSVYQVPITAG